MRFSTIFASLTIALGAMTIKRATAAEPSEPAAKAVTAPNTGLRRYIYAVQSDGLQPMGPAAARASS